MLARHARPELEVTEDMKEQTEVTETLGRPEPCLIQMSGMDSGQLFKLSGNALKIGRDSQCQIAFQTPTISRVHAEIVIKGNNDVILRDLGSTNGTFVNGEKVTETNLKDGDKILIGTRLFFKFSYQDAVDQSYQQRLFRAANIDDLTQLYNKSYFMDILAKEFSYSNRTQDPLSLLMIDIDHFKKVNDTHGHVAGDLALKTIGAFLKKNIRLENTACRFGGEEFVIMLRKVIPEIAVQIAERLRKGIEAQKIVFQGKNIPVTVSIGIATFDAVRPSQTTQELIQKADESLYEAKRGGRNRVVMMR